MGLPKLFHKFVKCLSIRSDDKESFTILLNRYFNAKVNLEKTRRLYEAAKKDYKKYSIPDENGEFPLTMMPTKELRKRIYSACKQAKSCYKKANSDFSKIEHDIYEFAGVEI